MSDPQPAPGKKTPRRAEPAQPDMPGKGDETGDSRAINMDDAADAASHTSHDRKDTGSHNQDQEEGALKNVRDGYK